MLILGDRVGHAHHYKPQAEADIYEPVIQRGDGAGGGGGVEVVNTNNTISHRPLMQAGRSDASNFGGRRVIPTMVDDTSRYFVFYESWILALLILHRAMIDSCREWLARYTVQPKLAQFASGHSIIPEVARDGLVIFSARKLK